MTSTPQRALANGFNPRSVGLNGSVRRGHSVSRDGLSGPGLGGAEEERDDDPIHQGLKARLAQTEASIAALFGADGQGKRGVKRPAASQDPAYDATDAENAKTSAPPKKAARLIDEDDYGDDDDEEEEEEDVAKESPLKAKGKAATPNGVSHKLAPIQTSASTDQTKSSEDVRKQLEEDKKAAVEAARRSFQSMFYTLENDRDAMLEQQKLDELDREVENEISGGQNPQNTLQTPSGNSTTTSTQGSLGSADLGASSLTLKHLIARIDFKRDMVKASDSRLRSLISEVRKGRSKWASEDRVGQEELYEASEKVLMELKAMTEYAQPFLARVSKREAPDYYNVIKTPMDIGTMLKKLKSLHYKSKKDFVDDLNLIWSNCLKYNQDPAHPLRKKALYMRKETDKLTPLIPEISVRDRAEVEAEERRLHAGDGDDSDDDDDAPIMASRGRKAPHKGGKGGPKSTSQQDVAAAGEDASSTPAPDVKPALHQSASALRNEFSRGDSEMHDVSSTGFSTPPLPGTATPFGINGSHGNGMGPPGSQADGLEGVGLGQSIMESSHENADEDDPEFKMWKQVTKKDRAQAAAERNRLFHGDQLKHLNTEEPALLRSKGMMRRWIRQQKFSMSDSEKLDDGTQADSEETDLAARGETLAEGIEKDEDSTLPDYYNPLSAIPELDEKLKWTEDSEGFVVPQTEEFMRIYPRNQYKAPEGALNKKMEANMRQMQETRKLVSKIGIVKQMQVQAQTYKNQFQKYEPQPFVEQDIGPVVVSEEGPIMAPWVAQKAFQRTVGKIFYHAGFEDFQPSALDAVTNLASDYFRKLIDTFKCYQEHPRQDSGGPRFSFEERVLHSLHENGIDMESMETYVKDDVERLESKLDIMHERMKLHLADLLRPAISENAGADGVGAFNDGSEQFVGGDFAEDLGEDFFGFGELGLAKELGLETLSVPLHLLQNRMHDAYQAQSQGPTNETGLVFPPPPDYDQISTETVSKQIGIVQGFFRTKLQNNHFQPLVEDERLPLKQKFPKPRLPPTGKISSPRKRPIREQQQLAKKKRKVEESGLQGTAVQPPVGKLRLEMPEAQENGQDPDKDGETNGPPSPESITAN